MIKIPQQKPSALLEVLIIDGQSLVHTLVKSALLDAGIQQVQSAHDAYAAIRLCEETDFDMILIAFDVRSDKDGFNLLEELKFKGHITKTTCVVFLSADTTQGLVNCVVEMEPTDFWVKPLDSSKVKKRVQQILLIEKKLYALRYCFDQAEYPTAIYYAERQLQDESLALYFPHINRLIGRSLFNLAEYQEAYDFYLKLTKEYDYAWVQVGLAATLLKLGKIEEANKLAKILLERDDTRFATYDLLAEYHIDKEEYQIGYEIIQEATKLAPRSLERNKKSWNLARLNHDRMGQYVATRNMAKYAKNSIHDSPDLTVNVIRSSLDLASTMSDAEAGKLLTSTEKTIERLLKEHSSASDLTDQLNVIQARILNLRNNKKDAEDLMTNNVKVKIGPDFENNLDKIKAFHEVGLWEQSMSLLDQLKSDFHHDSFTGKVLSEYLEQESKERQSVRYTPKELGEMASAHYKNKRFRPAYNLLCQAFQLTPTNPNIALSLLKVLVKLAEDINLKAEEEEQAKNCLHMLENEKLKENQLKNFIAYKKSLKGTGLFQE
ncbi:response regulator [Paraglaciecola aquimarina]|uniref:Response regulator n=1 Tax=Paraglaciecola algarum TaxID=3050085 RepID=A0ABS9D6M0_9ALTE|nr:response regulator [Paraglaciecola sp. G1-23]MCF2948334.1 response regulator [Paraglaciecola sp. G1-23]